MFIKNDVDSVKGKQRLALFASEDIQHKDELTFDYKFTLGEATKLDVVDDVALL